MTCEHREIIYTRGSIDLELPDPWTFLMVSVTNNPSWPCSKGNQIQDILIQFYVLFDAYLFKMNYKFGIEQNTARRRTSFPSA
jgi:hypothetical protein